ncbi:hypothetical protein ATANTOWER_002986 [Ataeniobius toweri]|uniref:Uncharacterized protein n=1 Tax=Ataeniobius toweri TaxID=208326 RepID=A0ABU7ADV1_9TELE|nr:hypothetical protein [Ataeniobius toweri]
MHSTASHVSSWRKDQGNHYQQEQLCGYTHLFPLELHHLSNRCDWQVMLCSCFSRGLNREMLKRSREPTESCQIVNTASATLFQFPSPEDRLNLCGGADFFLDNLHPLLNVQTGPAGAPEFSPIL